MGPAVQAATGLQRSWRTATKGRTSAGSLRKGYLRLFRIRVLPAVTRGSAGRDPAICEPIKCRTRTCRSPQRPPRLQMTEPAHAIQLAREISLREATALNMVDIIGVGPFFTLPLGI